MTDCLTTCNIYNNKGNMIECYASTTYKRGLVKGDAYTKLQSTTDNQRNDYTNMLMGDLNVKIGQDNTGYEEIIGKRNLG